MKKEFFIFSIILISLLTTNFVFSKIEIVIKNERERGEKGVFSETYDIKATIPQPKFISPKDGDVLKGKVGIDLEVPEGLGVEFYLRQPQSLVEIYLGSGEKREGDKFRLELESENIPNGEYFLFSKVLTPFGEYQSKEIKTFIQNEIKRDIQKEEEMKKKIEPFSFHLEEKNKETEKVIDETTKKIEEVIGETTEKIQKKLPEKEKEEIGAKLEVEKKEFISGAVVELENLKKAIEEEVKIEKNIPTLREKEKIKLEKENIKENFVKKMAKPIEEIKEKLPEEETFALKKEVEEKTKAILENTNIILKEKIKEKGEISPSALLDSDNDDLSDWDEIRLGTNPLSADSDGDGYLDSVEFKLGFDPLKPGPADKVVYQDVRKFGKVSERIKIEKVELVTLPGEKEGLKIYGSGIPNSFVTIYIYSKPIIALAKVNANGYFEYTLDKDLTDGTHTVYVALTNNKGEIEERSSPLVFIKSGEKILRISELQAEMPKSPVETLSKNFLILTLSVVLFALSVAFFIIGFLTKRQTGQQ